MKYCSHCVAPLASAVPNGLDASDVCGGCLNAEYEHSIDWDRRLEALRKLTEGYRSGNSYDLVIGVSGGKDSYFQTHFAIEELGLKPLLVTYHGNNYSPEGEENLARMRNVFDADHIVVRPSETTLVKMNRLGFFLQGDMNWHAHCGIFTVPFQMAVRYGVPIVLYGEHGFSNLGGMFTPDDMIEFSVRDRVEHALRGFDWSDFTDEGLAQAGAHHLAEGLSPKDLTWGQFPTDDEISKVGVRGIYLANFVPWDGVRNAEVAQTYGWEPARGSFERTYRTISNLDDIHENGAHDYLKFIKFGYGRGTDHSSKDVRTGRMSRAEAIEMVLEYDHVKPQRDLQRWLAYVDMTEQDFDATADTFRDPRVWWVEGGHWKKYCIDGKIRTFGRFADAIATQEVTGAARKPGGNSIEH